MDNMYVIFRSPVNLFKTVKFEYTVCFDRWACCFHYVHCVSVSLVVLAVYTCIIYYLPVIALIWYTPYACIQFLELLVLLNSQSIHQFEYFSLI